MRRISCAGSASEVACFNKAKYWWTPQGSDAKIPLCGVCMARVRATVKEQPGMLQALQDMLARGGV